MAETATRNKTAATKRSTTAKKAATTRKANAARSNARTTARKTTRGARSTARKAQTGAQRTARRVDVPQTSAERVQAYAEKAVLIPVGAVLAARESVLATADDLATKYGSRTAAERQLKAFRKDVERDLKKYERRGTSARNKVEREVKKTRTRVERELRNRRKVVEARTDLVTARAQNLVASASKTGAASPSRSPTGRHAGLAASPAPAGRGGGRGRLLPASCPQVEVPLLPPKARPVRAFGLSGRDAALPAGCPVAPGRGRRLEAATMWAWPHLRATRSSRRSRPSSTPSCTGTSSSSRWSARSRSPRTASSTSRSR